MGAKDPSCVSEFFNHEDMHFAILCLCSVNIVHGGQCTVHVVFVSNIIKQTQSNFSMNKHNRWLGKTCNRSFLEYHKIFQNIPNQIHYFSFAPLAFSHIASIYSNPHHPSHHISGFSLIDFILNEFSEKSLFICSSQRFALNSLQ